MGIFEKSTRPKKESPVGTYTVQVVSLSEELEWENYLPVELRYIFKQNKEYKEKIKKILDNGKAIGVRTMLRTPENILKAVHAISVYAQENYIITWLPKLLKDKHLPIINTEDKVEAQKLGADLDAAVETIVRDRLRFKRLVLIDEENVGILPEEQRLMTELTEVIYPLQVDYAVFRVIADNARERTHVAQGIIKALLVIGPIAHILEKFVDGLGKLFAASADDLLGEAAEISALRGSGFSWRELAKRGRILIPVFALATYGAFHVHGLIESGRVILGGMVFGFSAVALSLTTAIQSLFMYRKNVVKLMNEKKIGDQTPKGLTVLALKQDFTNPARLGLFIGASLAPVMGMLGALAGLMDNGWVLAAIGSTESVVAGITVLSADRINEWRFKRSLLNKIK